MRWRTLINMPRMDGVVRQPHALLVMPEPERPQGAPHGLGMPDPGANLLHCRARLALSSVGMTAARCPGPCRPTTGLRPIVSSPAWPCRRSGPPRPHAPGRSGDARPGWPGPSIVARTMLCGLVDPRLLVRMSVMPAHSSTARTGPPAMTPVPVAAGLSSTRPAPCWPMTSCGIVEPVLRQLDHRALGRIHRLAHRLRDLVGLAGRDADLALAVAHRHQSVEREPPAALDHLGHPVDGDDVLDVLAGAVPVTPVPPRAAPAAAVTPLATAPTPAPRPVGPGRPLGHRRPGPSVGRSRPHGPRPPGCRRVPRAGLRSACCGSTSHLPFRTPIRLRARRRRRPARDHGNGNLPGRTPPW